jgi:MFS family permease
MTATTAPGAAGSDQGHITGFGSMPYRSYVLTALTVIYILNFVDRGLLGVVAPDVMADLALSDTQFSLLVGLAFTVLYTTVGIPLAHMAETRNRVTIMAICVALWSLMTALCGLATSITVGGVMIGGFWVLLLFRVGVGVGEAGCTPPANSLIADYYPPKQRSSALGYYAMGVTLGTMLANVVAGFVLKYSDPIIGFLKLEDWWPFMAVGWRIAFVAVGLPGLIVAVVLRMTVKEPPRGYTDPPGTVRREKASFKEGMRELASKPAFWLMASGATIAAFCGYGISSFQTVFLTRMHGITTSDAALLINTPVAFSSALGTFFTGWLAMKIYTRYPGGIAWLPAAGLALSIPFYLFAFSSQNLWWALAGLVIGGFVKYGYLAAQYTIGQGVVSAQVRATATAILLFIVNLIGYSLGPFFIGALSDIFFRGDVAQIGVGVGELVKASQCHPRIIGDLASELQAVCGEVYSPALQKSMLITSAIYLGSSFFFLLTWRRLSKDMVSRNPAAPA